MFTTFNFWRIPSFIICTFSHLLRKFLNQHKNEVLQIYGFVDPRFEAVQSAFKKNFKTHLEPEGAAFSVYHQGELVVDLWAGYANSKTGEKWAEDTMCVACSTTKVATAICLALLVDRGMVDYDDLVVKYWPQFGKNGKSEITVRMLASHQAGLAVLDHDITYDTIRDWRKMSSILENQRPNWILGQKAGYHAITFGFLMDQLIRRTDPKERSLGTFFREEIAEVYDIDFYIGLPPEFESRVCRLIPPTTLQFFYDLSDPIIMQAVYQNYTRPHSHLLRDSLKNARWLNVDKNGETAFNDPELHALEIGAANGIGTSRSLAKLMSLIIGNKTTKPIFSKYTFDQISHPLFENNHDMVLGLEMTYGHGFIYSKNSKGTYQIGHTGFGGQNVRLDPEFELSFAYLHNGLSSDSGAYSRTFKIMEQSVYESVLKTE